MTRHDCKRTCILALATLTVSLVLTAPAAATTVGTEFVAPSTDSWASISHDGRYVAFSSNNSNLIPGDTNGRGDVFVKDLQTGGTQRVSVSTAGLEANGHSLAPTISGNGRFIAFLSHATNLSAVPTGDKRQVFVHDLANRTTTLASVNADGIAANGTTDWPAVSDDGRYVSYTSWDATNLTPQPPSVRGNNYWHDLVSGETRQVNVSTDGVPANSDGGCNAMSDDGRYVAFLSTANNLSAGDTNRTGGHLGRDIFLRDLVGGSTTRVSYHLDGTQVEDLVDCPEISGDGSVIAYTASRGGVHYSTAYDRGSSLLELLNVSMTGGVSNGHTFYPALSASGRFVTFVSTSTNLVAMPTAVCPSPYACQHVFLRDRKSGSTHLVTQNNDGSAMATQSFTATVSSSGRYISYAARRDTYDYFNVYRADRGAATDDTSPPVVTAVPDRSPDSPNWYNGAVTVGWSVTDDSGPLAAPASVTVSTDGAGQVVESALVCDPSGNCATGSVSLSIDSTAPTIGALAFGGNPKGVSSSTTVSASVSDALSGVVRGEFFLGSDPGAGNGTPAELVDGRLQATVGTEVSPGVYTLSARVVDAAGNWSLLSSEYLVVYDPEGGFVSGGGRIDSPLGAYVADPTLTGSASFGFVSKYQKGATVPTGNTEFQFRAAGFRFASEQYEWLVVSGARAQYKGSGSVNGQSGFGFLLTVTDGELDGGGGTDKFRLKVTDTAGQVVYDNLVGSDDQLDKGQGLAGGSIKIHKQ